MSDQYCQKGYRAQSEKRIDAALAAYEQSLAINNLDAYYQVTKLLMRKEFKGKHIEKCHKYLNEGLKFAPNDQIMLLRRSVLFLVRGGYVSAQKDIEKCLRLLPLDSPLAVVANVN